MTDTLRGEWARPAQGVGGRFRRLRGPQRIIVVSAIGFLLFLLWAAFAQVDEVTRGQGQVIPSSRVQVIQSAEPATIGAILVRPGQQVRRGQLLVRLDNPESAAALAQLQTENQMLEARATRLGQEGQGSAGACPPDQPGCQEEAALQRVRASTLQSQMAALNAAVEQKRRELGEAQATVQSLSSSVQLAQRNVDMLEPLAARNIVPQTELLTARRELVDTQGRLAAARESVSRASAGIREAQAQASEAASRFRQEALNERSQIATRIAVNEQNARGAAGRAQRSAIRSPVDGVVNDVQVTTIGGFVNPGQKIMEVVPMGERLLIETRVRPNDIAFIRVGDRAMVKVTAYDFATYGGLEARVVQVAADSSYDERTHEAYFTVIVETGRSYLLSGTRRLPITPGMMCDVEIVTGRKSILDYLLKPVLRAHSESLRER